MYVCASVQVCMRVCVHVCICAFVYMCIYIHLYTHTHTHTCLHVQEHYEALLKKHEQLKQDTKNQMVLRACTYTRTHYVGVYVYVSVCVCCQMINRDRVVHARAAMLVRM